MKTGVLIVSLLISILLLNGCGEEKVSPSYFEIVTDSSNFHEIIIVTSGEVFEKVGMSNLDLENQVKTPKIQKEIAFNLFNKAKEIVKTGTDCEYGAKQIIVFENNSVTKGCFYNSEFDTFFEEVKKETSQVTPLSNFFIHLITYDRGQAIDRHLHADGLLISTYYTGNRLTSAQMETLPVEKVIQLKQLITEQVLTGETVCPPEESNFTYTEIQKDNMYTYYYNCQKNNADKTSFFNSTKNMFGE
jgi:hypothetical protein